MYSDFLIREYIRIHNAEGAERQRAESCEAGEFLRSIGMDGEALARYQDRVAGIGDRLESKMAAMRKPPRLFR